ncbi:MAG: hypothetical protein ACRDTT_08595 [Pseudonocardiaceae bacterium]
MTSDDTETEPVGTINTQMAAEHTLDRQTREHPPSIIARAPLANSSAGWNSSTVRPGRPPRSSDTAPVFVGAVQRRQPERLHPVPDQPGGLVFCKRKLRSGVELAASVDDLVEASPAPTRRATTGDVRGLCWVP